MDWAAAEVIALAAVIVTGLSVWLGYREAGRRREHEEVLHRERLAHEAEIHESRLAHERAEAVRTTAANAYSHADAVIRHINQNTIHTIAVNFAAGEEYGARNAVTEAMDALGFVAALGWNVDVRDSAAVMNDEISKLASKAWATAGAIRKDNPNASDLLDQLEGRVNAVLEALEVYRKAVAGE